jgi:hypothetical protein
VIIQTGVHSFSQMLPETALIFANAIKSYSRNGARPIACPNCGRPMTLSHTDREIGVTPKVNTFACKECGVYYTEAADGGGA